ncbi:hypothetical protein [Micromonospora maritima]|uniref:hypothetical protein n=1 Tax=Micromonospora maritima TaxID=986711 RepID=UPI00157CE8B8|nr:hypothetical protein [Micromonospora maritima]
MRAWRLFALDTTHTLLRAPQVGNPLVARHLARAPQPWTSRELRPACLLVDGHVPPVPECFCGVYAVADRRLLERVAAAGFERVIAEVDLTGPVLPDPTEWTTGVPGLRAAGGTLLSLEIQPPPQVPVPDFIAARPDLLAEVQRRIGSRFAWWTGRAGLIERLQARYEVPVTAEGSP